MLARKKNLRSTAPKQKFLEYFQGVFKSQTHNIVTPRNRRVFKRQVIRNVHLDPPGVFNTIQSWTSKLLKSNAGTRRTTRILECYSKLQTKRVFSNIRIN